MTATKGTPAWYLEGGNDIHKKHFDTDAAKGVVEEARALLFGGQTPNQARQVLHGKGAGLRSIEIVTRASKLEWDATVGAASTDVEAGQFQTPHVAAARRLALEITKEDPSGADFRKKIALHGASEALANYLASDPEINRTANQSGRTMLVLGLIGLGASVFGAFAVFGADKPDGSAVGGLLMVFGASVTGVWRGAAGMRRKAGTS
jgi:hypothetical protein